jgi:hypothetical protein
MPDGMAALKRGDCPPATSGGKADCVDGKFETANLADFNRGLGVSP